MQQFTRALTREITVGGERLAVTFDKDGLSVRPVGSRRPPMALSWEAVVVACTRQAGGGTGPATHEELDDALRTLKGGGDKAHRSRKPAESTAESPATPAPTPAPAAAAPPAHGPGLQELLARLDHWLAAHRPRYHQGLRPRATPEELSALQAALGQPVPDDLRTWLTWHNGQSDDVVGALEENWHPMSTDQIAEAKKDLDAGGHAGWQRDWIPLLDDDNDNYLVLGGSQPGAPVRECWHGKAEHGVAAASLAVWVERLVQGLEQGAYQEDPERGAMYRS
jgi:cell wall assembly regulator SMI1